MRIRNVILEIYELEVVFDRIVFSKRIDGTKTKQPRHVSDQRPGTTAAFLNLG